MKNNTQKSLTTIFQHFLSSQTEPKFTQGTNQTPAQISLIDIQRPLNPQKIQ